MTETYTTQPWRHRGYWVLSRRGRSHETFLLVDDGEPGLGKALPVFTAEGLAVAFLRSSGLGNAWRSKRVDGGELISVLYGPCWRVGGVAMNPLGGAAVEAGLHVDVGRGAFLDMLSGRSRRVTEGVGTLVGA